LDLGLFSSLCVLSLETVSMATPILPSSIEHLRIVNCNFHTPPSKALYEFANLKTLKMEGCLMMPGLMDEYLKNSKGSLERCELKGCDIVDISNYINRGLLDNVKLLQLAHTVEVDDTVILDLVRSATQIEAIDLSLAQVTGAAIKTLVLSEKNLRKMTLVHCDKVSADAVEYARKRGITVNYSFPEAKRKYAKKIRTF
jgi:hypothetical protein